VRWQAQDEEGALLRDQLKQAARLWEEKGRPNDLLWTGSSEREFELWRERYPGALTAVESDFASAMVHRALRRKRMRRVAAAGVMIGLSAITAVICVSRQQAVGQARRAEAARLVALGRVELDRYPTEALAYVRKSLELADSSEARRFAVEVMSRGPTARLLPVDRIARELGTAESRDFIGQVALSPDGRWLATVEMTSRAVHLFPRDGGPVRALPPDFGPDSTVYVLGFGPQGDLLVTGGSNQTVRFWSLPDLRALRAEELGGGDTWGVIRGETLFTFTWMSADNGEVLVRAWPLSTGDPEVLGTLMDPSGIAVDPTGTWLAFGRGRTVRVRRLDVPSPASERVLGGHPEDLFDVTFVGAGDRVASIDRGGEIRIWSLGVSSHAPIRALKGTPPPASAVNFIYGACPKAALLATSGEDSSAVLWNLERPPYVAPSVFQRPDLSTTNSGTFDPAGRWLVTGNGTDVAFWPLGDPSMSVLSGPAGGEGTWSMAFTPDGRWLVAPSVPHAVSWWPLDAESGEVPQFLPDDTFWWSTRVHPAGTHVLLTNTLSRLVVAPIRGGPTPDLLEQGWEGQAAVAAFDEPGRRVVGAPLSMTGLPDPADRVLRVWDLDSGEEQAFSLAHLTDSGWKGLGWIRVGPDGSVFAGGLGSGWGGVHRLTLPADPGRAVTRETLYDTGAGSARFDLSRDGRHLLAWGTRRPGELNHFDELRLFDLEEGTSRRITTHGSEPFCGALDPSGRIVVTGDMDGVVRVGPSSGEEPHLLYGHTGPVTALAVSPDGSWIASASNDSVRLWPMPDVTKPPFHALAYEELMARLRALTNLEVVEDETAATGYRPEVGPFPGWETVPTW
jgi:WD40 repeat protein